jgi:hypothetical protein
MIKTFLVDCRNTDVTGGWRGAQVMGPLILFYSIALLAILTKLVSLIRGKKKEQRALQLVSQKVGGGGMWKGSRE